MMMVSEVWWRQFCDCQSCNTFLFCTFDVWPASSVVAARQRSWGKVMFSQVSVSHSVYRGCGISGPMFFLGVCLVPGPFWGVGMSGGMSKGVGHVWGQVFPGGMGMSREWVSTPPDMGPGIQQDTVGKFARYGSSHRCNWLFRFFSDKVV